MKEDRDVPSSNDRMFPRLKLETPVACMLAGRLAFETCVEISEGGLLMKINRDYRVGEVLELRFFIPGSDSFSVTGEIAYLVDSVTDGPLPSKHAGIRFVDPPDRLRFHIRELAKRI